MKFIGLLVDWWLTPTLAVFQLYRGVSRFNNFKKLKTTMFIDVTYQTLRMSTEYDVIYILKQLSLYMFTSVNFPN
jgi:hypothetical protein